LSIVEIVISSALLSGLIVSGVQIWQIFQGKASENLSKRLVLQMEARRALLSLFRVLQEGIEVVTPSPGTTLPYLVFKDGLNNLRMVYLEEDPARSKEEKRTIYRAMIVVRDPTNAAASEPHALMENVVKLHFTTWSPGGVLITTTLHKGTGDFSLVNFVRLQNVMSDEEY